MSSLVEIKEKYFFEILKRNNFIIKRNLSDYVSFIETIVNKKLKTSSILANQKTKKYRL